MNIFLQANFSITPFYFFGTPKIWPPPKKFGKIMKNSAIDSSLLAASESKKISGLTQGSRPQIIN